MVHQRKVKAKCKRRSKICTYHMKTENIPILVEERWDAFRCIPKLRRFSLLEYLLEVPWSSPSLSSCLSSFFSHRDLLDLQSSSTQNFNRKLGKLEPKSEKCVFIGNLGYTFYLRSEGKIFVAKNGSFLEK